MATEDPAPSSTCQNCGSAVSTKYCGECGQEAVASVLSFRELVSSALDSYFSLDSKIVRSLVPLVRYPGRLTEEYVRGRRQRYVSPVRLYLVSSLIFFVVAGFLVAQGSSGFLRISNTSNDASSSSDSTSVGSAASLEAGNFVNVQVDSSSASTSTAREGRSAAFFQRLFETDPQVISSHFLRQLPRALFVLVPIYALLLKLVYVRRSRLYLEHLVFALHAHAFIFLIGTPAAMTRSSIAANVVFILSWIYTFLAMKRFYAQGWFKTVAKFVLLQLLYGVLLALTMVTTLVLTVLFSLD